jgi:glycosyltransferase involved in cell wall biosynthesis
MLALSDHKHSQFNNSISELDGELPALPLGIARRPTVSVVIPTLNESKNLPLVLPYIPLDWVDEVILVDGRSTDDTVEVARLVMPSIKVVMEKTPGKGAAMRAGYAASKGDIIIILDADGSNDPREIPRFVKALIDGVDMAKGSRFATGGGTTDMPRIRKWGNGTFVHMVNFLFGTRWTDLCYGYHAFWRHSLNEINLDNVNGFEIDTSLYLKAVQAKLRVTEVPSFEGYRFFGYGKLQTIPDGWRVLKTIMKEWKVSITASQKDLYLGFRGFRPIPDANRERLAAQFMQMLYIAMSSGLNNTLVTSYMLQNALKAVGAHSGTAVVLDESGNVIDGFHSCEGDLQSIDVSSISDVVQDGLTGWVIKNRQPVLVSNTGSDPRWLRRPWDISGEVSRSAIAVPIIVGGRIIAVLTLLRPDENRFTEQELDLFRGVSSDNLAYSMAAK